jgi:hypothetical protein
MDTATLASFNEFEEACIQKQQLIPVLSQSSIIIRLHRCTWCMNRKWQIKTVRNGTDYIFEVNI